LRLSIQRARPFCGHVTSKGLSSARGSPAGTIGSENRAVTWRTCFTVPRGENCSTLAGGSSPCDLGPAITMAAAAATSQRQIRICALV
jgi:hypothetical protein